MMAEEGGRPGRAVQHSWPHRLLAASSPALAWVAVGQPFDVIRARLQTTSKARFAGPWHCLRTTVTHEGPTALWKGSVPSLVLAIPFAAVLFGSYDLLRPHTPPLHAPKQCERDFYVGVCRAGMMSGVLLTMFQNPLDVWRTRLQTSTTPHHHALLWELLKGPTPVRQLMRGFSMTAVRNIPGNGLLFFTQEWTARQLEQHTHASTLRPFKQVLSGALTGVLVSLTMCPIDVMRARLMVTAPTDGGLLATARQVHSEQGLGGFYRGGLVQVVKSMTSTALAFWLLGTTRSWLDGTPQELPPV